MDFVFSKHAVEQIKDRDITKGKVSLVIRNPDAVIDDSNCKKIYQKLIKQGESKYLYRVFVNICKSPNLIITAYKTSKIDKYEH